MQYTGFIKRFLPFALTFVGGLLIASLFVPIGFGRFGERRYEQRRNEVRELRMEVEQLRKEKCDLRRQLEEAKSNSATFESPLNLDTDVEFSMPVPPPAAVAPVAPHRHR